jgi:hypothetical protein
LRRTTCDAAGRFDVRLLPAGSLLLHASEPDADAASHATSVLFEGHPGETVDLGDLLVPSGE